MAAKFFTGLPLDGPDPECVRGFGQQALAEVDAAAAPRSSADHSHSHARSHARRSERASRSGPVPVSIGPRPADSSAPCGPGDVTGAAVAGIGRRVVPDRACDQHPLAGFTPRAGR
jgi:hypothetical protein